MSYLFIELRCIPVSAMIHIPFVQNALNENGKAIGQEADIERWRSYSD
jgi:hypothetical protein